MGAQTFRCFGNLSGKQDLYAGDGIYVQLSSSAGACHPRVAGYGGAGEHTACPGNRFELSALVFDRRRADGIFR